MDQNENPEAQASARPPLWPPGTGRKTRDLEQQKIIALRKIRAFVSRGADHYAELSINRALDLGVPVPEVSAALEDLGPEGACLTRREALQRSVVLLAGGALFSSGWLDDGRRSAGGRKAGSVQRATTASRPAPSGLFLQLPGNAGDGTYSLAAVPAAGLGHTTGPYIGDAVASGGLAYNVGQSWQPGSAYTAVTIISADGATTRFTVEPPGSRNGAAIAESLTSVTLAGNALYCLNTWLRIYRDGTLPAAKGGGPRMRLVAQPTIDVVDLATRQLSDRWLGPEVPGACKATLKVSADGSGVLLVADMPSASSDVPRVYTFRFSRGQLSLIAGRTPASALLNGLGSEFYSWSSAAAPLVQVDRGNLRKYQPADNHESSASLPVQYGNNRMPPAFQAVFTGAGRSIISSGDGRIIAAAADAAPRLVTTLPGKTLHPPLLAYQGARLVSVLAPQGRDTWVVDNREGIGGLWRCDGNLRPISHELAGNYISACQTDSSGRYVAALSSLERALYLIDPAGRTVGFSVPAYAALVPSSEGN